MTTLGWILMIASVGGTTGWFIWCLLRVLRAPDASARLHGMLDTERAIEEQDRD